MNCETDFVARNSTFQELASTITTALHNSTTSLQDNVEHFTTDVIGRLQSGDRNLGDLVAESVGQLGENIVLNRGCKMSASSGLICGYAYNNMCPPDSQLLLGTYGALVHLVPTSRAEFGEPNEISSLGRKLCQQVVAMNPKVVNIGDSGTEDPSQVLVSQEFMFDSSITVGELLLKSGVEVVNFVRYALGETLSVQ